MRRNKLSPPIVIALFFASVLFAGPPQISQDRDLLELDLTKWDCANRAEGTAKTPDGVERNRLKNRPPTDLAGVNVKSFDVAGFLKYIGDFDSQTKGKRRKDLVPAERQKLAPLEKEIVQVTGYLGLAYAGPPETTNCASVDFHDWHLEVMEKPPEHSPQIGDATSLICEITPRTQNAIYHDKLSIQALAGFFRRFDLEYEPTGHPARKVRVTGYLLWDDEHNGSADIGTTIQRISANKYHNPWRLTAWEIHPVLKIEPLDGTPPSPSPNESEPPQPGSSPSAIETPTPTATATPTPPQIITLLKAVPIRIPYGETVLPPGTKLKALSHDAQTVTVDYMGKSYPVPISSTDFH